MPDPPFSYEATRCDVIPEGREYALVFGQNGIDPAVILNALAVNLAKEDAAALLDGFGDIIRRLDDLAFTDDELESRRLDRERVPQTHQSFRRERAQAVRASCSNEMAILDFYVRPPITAAIVRARRNQDIALIPVIRLTCHPEVLGLLVRLLQNVAGEDSK